MPSRLSCLETHERTSAPPPGVSHSSAPSSPSTVDLRTLQSCTITRHAARFIAARGVDLAWTSLLTHSVHATGPPRTAVIVVVVVVSLRAISAQYSRLRLKRQALPRRRRLGDSSRQERRDLAGPRTAQPLAERLFTLAHLARPFGGATSCLSQPPSPTQRKLLEIIDQIVPTPQNRHTDAC